MYYRSDVEIRTFIVKIGNSSFTVGHEAWQEGELKARGQAVLVYYDFKIKKSMPLPNKIRDILKTHIFPATDTDEMDTDSSCSI
jgi:acyl-CoA thioester hydrolase